MTALILGGAADWQQVTALIPGGVADWQLVMALIPGGAAEGWRVTEGRHLFHKQCFMYWL